MKCQRCSEREGTEIWSEGGALAYVHGFYVRWCARCCTEVQLEHANKMAGQAPELTARLADLGGPWQKPQPSTDRTDP